MRELPKTDFNLEEYLPIISEVIESGGEFRLFPRGTSMRPLIRQGVDSVVLVKCEGKIRRGDIILYRRESGQLVLHRVVKVEKNGTYTLCGDNQTQLEKGIERKDVLAVVSALYRGEKRISNRNLRFTTYKKIWCVMPIRKAYFRLRSARSKIKKIFKTKQ